MGQHRKTVRHYHEPGNLHELTFSCYRRLPLLNGDHVRGLLCTSIDRALTTHDFRLVAFVLMPEHVHLLVYPLSQEPRIDRFLFAIKRPFSYRVKQHLIELGSPQLQDLTVRERPEKTTFRFWQEGPGFDRNFSTQQATMNAIAYIHENPVRRGLVEIGRDWKWSSARWYADSHQSPDLPKIHGLPSEFFV